MDESPFLNQYINSDDQPLVTNNRGRTKFWNFCCQPKVLVLVALAILGASILGVVVISWAASAAVRQAEIDVTVLFAAQYVICFSDEKPLLLISMDGFRFDYLSRGITPNISQFGGEGVKARQMTPVFPSETFPNHYSIVTGLYPESHGIVANYFYDTDFKQVFSISRTSNQGKWWLGEPIWVTAIKNKLKAYVYFWPGSEATIQNITPTVFFKYNSNVPFTDRVDTVLSWFDLSEEKRPELMLLYFNQPDHNGHVYGPNSTQVNDALGEVDNAFGQLIDGLKNRGIYDCTNIMLVSDHGFATVFPNRTVSLSGGLLPSSITKHYCPSCLVYGVFSNLYVPDNNHTLLNETYNTLQKDKGNGKIFDVYLRGEAPAHYHMGFSNKQRYGNISVVSKVHGYIKKNNGSTYSNKGTHGYDNEDKLMQTIFLARGPSFKKGYVRDKFENIQLYNLMCTLLDINPAPNNGTANALADLLSSK